MQCAPTDPSNVWAIHCASPSQNAPVFPPIVIMMTMNVEAWRVVANFGQTVGVHTGIRLIRYRKDGPLFMPLDTLCEVFTIAKTTLKSAVQQHTSGHYVEERADVLQTLRHFGVVGTCASKVHLLRISLAERLMRTFDVDAHARDVLWSLSTSTPPPRPPSSDAPTTRLVSVQCLCDALPTPPNHSPSPIGDRVRRCRRCLAWTGWRSTLSVQTGCRQGADMV
jgi:hypothetical protein